MARKKKPEVRVKILGRNPFPPIKVPSHTAPAEVSAVLLRALVVRTPVDTGRARRGWKPQILKLGNIWIRNDVPYVQYLEDGHSQQAPHGFVNQAMAVARSVITRNSRRARRAS